jgi:hypothetical protein
MVGFIDVYARALVDLINMHQSRHMQLESSMFS